MGTVDMSQLRIPERCTLVRKELFEYSTEFTTYQVELFEQQDHSFYAIGIPKDSDRVMVYGSNVVPEANMAMQILIDKIRREGVDVLFPRQSSNESEPE